jgi:dihydropteroate synthase
MGIVNVTPDSFSDGGRFLAVDAATEHGLALARAGAAVLDVGGESTRPGAEPVSADEELARVLPVVRNLVSETNIPVSIDTMKAAVAAAALDAGAVMVNDVSGGRNDPQMLAVVAEAHAAYVAMHMRGTPQTMRDHTDYADVVADVGHELRARIDAAVEAGVDIRALLADPGIGFAKSASQSWALLRALPQLAVRAGVPLLVGTSRKSFLSTRIGDAPFDKRDDATLAATVWCFEEGAAMVRVHDVAGSQQAAALLDAMERAAA